MFKESTPVRAVIFRLSMQKTATSVLETVMTLFFDNCVKNSENSVHLYCSVRDGAAASMAANEDVR